MLSGRNIMSPHNAMVLADSAQCMSTPGRQAKVLNSPPVSTDTFSNYCVELGGGVVSTHSILLAAKGQRLHVHLNN